MTRIRLLYVHEFLDRHGKVRRYFRRPGVKRIPLPGLPGSPEFMRAYQAALDGAPRVEVGATRTHPGTINALVVAYYNSADFKHALAPATQLYRRNIIEKFRAEYGHDCVATLQHKHIVAMVAKIEKPQAKRNWLKAIRGLLAYAVTIGMREDDPTQGVKTKIKKSAGFYTWEEADIAAYRERHTIGSTARLALELLLGTAQRRSDVIRMGPQHVHDGVLAVRQQKTGVSLAIPISPELAAAIDAMPAQHLTFLTMVSGKPFSAVSFSRWFRARCGEVGLPMKCSAHGLRKAACRRLAEAGCSANEIAAISGHATLREVERYTKAADQARMARAAMASVHGAFGTKTATSAGKPTGLNWQTRPNTLKIKD